ncbi:MAG: hypothetical protein PHS88_09830, partial [Candidatus Omnitrophica bacterium]|nr:hypothetical protein [Candidatus Omnitrophota bacterium]
MNQRYVLRFVAGFTAILFINSTILWSAPALPAFQNPVVSAQSPENEIIQVLNQLPADLGFLQKSYIPEFATKNPPASKEAELPENNQALTPFVVHIQDAHSNPDAQARIRDMLNWLDVQFGSKEGIPAMIVTLEGTVGAIHPEYLELFSEFPEANESFVKDLHEKGELNGAELFAWDQYKKRKAGQSQPVEIRGAETPELYRDNLKMFRDLLMEQGQVDSGLKPLRGLIEIAKSRILNPELRDFLRAKEQSKHNPPVYFTHELAKAADRVLGIDLKDRIEQLRFPNLTRLIYLSETEPALRQEAAKSEWKTIRGKLTEAGVGEEWLSILDGYWENTKAHPMPLRRAFEKVFENAKARGIPFADYPNYVAWASYALLSQEVKSQELFEEVKRLEQAIEEKLAAKEDEKKFLEIYRDYVLFEKLLHLELTRSELDQLEALDGRLLPKNLAVRVASLSGYSKDGKADGSVKTKVESLKVKELEGYFNRAGQFYLDARRRDEALLENTIKAAREHRSKVLVMVTGGFHTEGLTSLMEERKIAHMVFAPRITKVDGGGIYHKVMRRENADVSDYFKDPSLLNKQEALFFKGLVEQAAPALATKYQVPAEDLPKWVAQAIQSNPVLKNRFDANADLTANPSYVRLQAKDRDAAEPLMSQTVPETPVTTGVGVYGRLAQPDFAGGRALLAGQSEIDVLFQSSNHVTIRRSSIDLESQVREPREFQKETAESGISRSEQRRQKKVIELRVLVNGEIQSVPVLVREAGNYTVDVQAVLSDGKGGYRFANKRDALLDALQILPPELRDPANLRPGDVVCFAVQNYDEQDRGGVLATLPFVKLYALDQPNATVWQKDNIERLSVEVTDEAGMPHRVGGVKATEEGIRRILAMPPDQRPKMVTFGFNNVVVELRPVSTTQIRTTRIPTAIVEGVADLIKAGIKVAFLSDDHDERIRNKAAKVIADEIREQMAQGKWIVQGEPQHEVEIYYYVDGVAMKFLQHIERDDDSFDAIDHYGGEYVLQPEVMSVIRSVVGEVRQELNPLTGRRDLVIGRGLMWDYYRTRFSTRTEDGHYVPHSRLTRIYPSYYFPMTNEGNVVSPKLRPSEHNTWTAISSFPSEHSPHNFLQEEGLEWAEDTERRDEARKSERHWFFEELCERLSEYRPQPPTPAVVEAPRPPEVAPAAVPVVVPPGVVPPRGPQTKPFARPIAEYLAVDKFDHTHRFSDDFLEVFEGSGVRIERVMSLRKALAQMERLYRGFVDELARVSLVSDKSDPEYGKIPKDRAKREKVREANIAAAERKRKAIVLEYYRMGQEAMKKPDPEARSEDTQDYRSNFAVAVYAFSRVYETRPLQKHALDAIIEGKFSRPPEDLYPVLEADYGYQEIDRLDIDYEKALKAYQAQVHYLEEMVKDNILYDLRLDPDFLFKGDSYKGRPSATLLRMVVSLATLINMPLGNRINVAVKARAAEFLLALLSRYPFNGDFYKDLDESGGLPVPNFTELIRQKDIDVLQQAALDAVVVMLHDFRRPSEALIPYDSLAGISRAAIASLTEVYESIAEYYRKKVRDQAIHLELQRRLPWLVELERHMDSIQSYDDLVTFYAQPSQPSFVPVAGKSVKAGKAVLMELPVRLEVCAGGIGDPASISTLFPSFYKIVNAPVLMTKKDGSMGRNIQIFAQIVKQEVLGTEERGGVQQPVVTKVKSHDMRFDKKVVSANDITSKSEATFVLDTMVSLGIFPRRAMQLAVAAKREVEMAKILVENFIGKGNGIAVDLLVDNIPAGSGLAVSNLLAVGIAAIFSQMVGDQTEVVSEDGYAEFRLEISTNGKEVAEQKTIGLSADEFSYELEMITPQGVVRSLPAAPDEYGRMVGRMPLGQFGPYAFTPGTYTGVRVKLQYRDRGKRAWDSVYVSDDYSFTVENVAQLTVDVPVGSRKIAEEGYYEVVIAQGDQSLAFDQEGEVVTEGDRWVRKYPAVLDEEGQLSVEMLTENQTGRLKVLFRHRANVDVPGQPGQKEWQWGDWSEPVFFNINFGNHIETAESPDAEVNRPGLTVRSAYWAWKHYDKEEDVLIWLLLSQITQKNMGNEAGSQDDISARPGVKILQAGDPLYDEHGTMVFPGSIVPKVSTVYLSDEAREAIDNNVIVIRIGPKTPAEHTLLETRTDYYTNQAIRAAHAWAQISIETIKAMVRGDTVQLGRLGMASVPLRQTIAPVSIEPIVVDPLMRWVRKHRNVTFSISGARVSGSTPSYFPPEMSPQVKRAIVGDLVQTLQGGIARPGKNQKVEDQPGPRRIRLIAKDHEGGARIRTFDAPARSELRLLDRVLSAADRREGHDADMREANSNLYPPTVAVPLLDWYHRIPSDERTLHDPGLITVNPDIVGALQDALRSGKVLSYED